MKKVIVYGLGVSGEAMYGLLKNECRVLLFCDDGKIPDWARGAEILTLDSAKKELDGLDALLLSPSISQDRPLVRACRELKIPILGELELGYIRSKCRVVAVTGTNGKTTTVSLINHILRVAGRNSFALGNIGVPFCSMCDMLGEEDVAVLEVSSFQLESCARFAPFISAVLNITPDHLDRHGEFNNYVSAKAKIFSFQREGFCIFNADDPVVRAIEWRAKANKLFFSTEKRAEGCYLENGKIVLKIKKQKEIAADASRLKIKGIHNVRNAMCAILVCFALGLDCEDIRRGLLSFNGVEHRLESIGSVGGVKFINDSKSTNVDSTLKAVEAFSEKIHLILGGRDKNSDFCELFARLPSRVKKIALIGEASEKLLAAARGKFVDRCFRADGLEDATGRLFNTAKRGDLILLSPACASFDEYENYRRRGEHFKEIVGKLKNETD